MTAETGAVVAATAPAVCFSRFTVVVVVVIEHDINHAVPIAVVNRAASKTSFHFDLTVAFQELAEISSYVTPDSASSESKRFVNLRL